MSIDLWLIQAIAGEAIRAERARIAARIRSGPYGSPICEHKMAECDHGHYRWEDCVDCAMIDMAKDIEGMT